MKTEQAVLSLPLLAFGILSYHAAMPAPSGISPAAHAAVKPVFVPWIKCNKVLDNDIGLFQGGNYSGYYYADNPYCINAYSYVRGILLDGNLSRNVAMDKAIDALSTLLNDKSQLANEFEIFAFCESSRPECPGNHDLDTDVLPTIKHLIAQVTKDKGLSTRFWYYLYHTATKRT